MPARIQKPRTIHFVSLGCAKNRVDTEIMAGIALRRGLQMVADPRRADIIVVNTCAFIESARQESVDTLLQMARLGAGSGDGLLVAAGCLAQRYPVQLAREMPELSHLLGTGYPNRIGRIIAGKTARIQVGPAGHFLQNRRTPRWRPDLSASAYIKIADGCSRRCSFCAIPSIRGRARSRPLRDIVREASKLAREGTRELCLVAQDTSAYGRDRRDDADLVRLLDALGGVDEIAWVRLLYLYPDAMSNRLFDAIGGNPKVVPYLDIPIQHASRHMLRRMRRGHGPDRIKRLLDRIRNTMPGAFLRTAVLVGHPGETEEDFKELIRFLEWAQFDHLGVFRYSDEEGTASYRTEPAVTRRVSYNRLRKVLALGRRISRQKNKRLQGTVLEVLVEGAADEHGYVLVGRYQGQAPEVDGVTYIVSSSARPGEMIRARVIRTGPHDLVVEPLPPLC